jgi:2-hydroxy-3-oxopropionate reductase
MSERERIGFVGLGVMGTPMARNLLRAGYDVVLFNRTPEKAATLIEDGGAVAESLRDLAERSDVVITMLPDDADVRLVLAGESGVLEGARPGQLAIDMSTISPVVARELASAAAERGVGMLDAPVSGGDVGAREGRLSIMVGGESAEVERARPILGVLGSAITHVGPAGAGQVTKACNQIVVALTIAAVSEALALGSEAGVEPERILDALRGGLAGSKVIDLKGEKLLTHDFEPGFRVDLHHKDLGIALATAREFNIALPLTAAVDQMLQKLRRQGLGAKDHTALLALMGE